MHLADKSVQKWVKIENLDYICNSKAELLQLKTHPYIYMRYFMNKVGNQKN